MTGATILGCSGPVLTEGERAFFRDADPWGFILFRRNVEDAAQLRALTGSLREAVGWHAAVAYLADLGMERVREHERVLAAYALEALRGVKGLEVYGRAPERCGVISFRIDGLHPHDVAQWVDRRGVALRAGHGCAQPLMKALGTQAVSRASFYVYNDRDDVDVLVAALEDARRFFGHGTG